MTRVLVHRETPVEYFKTLVERALVNQGTQVRDETAYYLVNLLSGFVDPSRGPAGGADLGNEPMAIKLGRALQAGGVAQRAALREVGDLSLFLAGFFGDSVRRSVVDVDYYISLGGSAYGSLSRCEQLDTMAELFAELARRFGAFVDVLAEVSECSALTSHADLLRTYEKWLRTGSPREGQRLVALGIVPNASIGSRFLQ